MTTGRRVIDHVTGQLGTVVAQRGDGGWRRYLVHWDEPTPHQDDVWPKIPSAFFDWYTEPEPEDWEPDEVDRRSAP